MFLLYGKILSYINSKIIIEIIKVLVKVLHAGRTK